jgi:hypothetical protein
VNYGLSSKSIVRNAYEKKKPPAAILANNCDFFVTCLNPATSMGAKPASAAQRRFAASKRQSERAKACFNDRR